MPFSQKRSVLIVDDESEIRESLSSYLKDEGFIVQSAADGKQMKEILSDNHIDLVLLDLGLPNGSGLDLLKNNLVTSDIAVVILTGKSDPIERVVALELGADDYIVKPFLQRELLARINAVLRRTYRQAQKQERIPCEKNRQIRINNWLIDLQMRQVQTTKGNNVELTGVEFDLLSVLASNVGEVMSRNQLSLSALHREWEPSDRSLDIHIHNLRKKLSSNDSMEDMIITVRNAGYLLAAEVHSE